MKFTVFNKTITILVEDSLRYRIDRIVEVSYEDYEARRLGETYPKIRRIKAHRQIEGSGLLEAKEAIEAMYEDNGQGKPVKR